MQELKSVTVPYPLPPFLRDPGRQPGHSFEGVVPLQERSHCFINQITVHEAGASWNAVTFQYNVNKQKKPWLTVCSPAGIRSFPGTVRW